MLNYFLRLRRKKGFTLVELIIVVAILAVLMASMAALSGPIRKMVSRTSASADAIAANVTMANYIENRLSFAANIEILCAYNATDATSSAVNDAFNDMKAKLTASSDTRDKAGILIFRYVEDTQYPEESHYEMYDVPIAKTDVSYFNTALTSSGGTNEIKESTAVFADCMYNYSKNLFIFPTELTTNSVRDNIYMTVDVIPYNFDADMIEYDSNGKAKTYITSDIIPGYYMYKANRDAELISGADPSTFLYTDESCGLSAIDIHRSGTKETATFELQNIMAPTDAEPTADINTRFKVYQPAPGAPSTNGSDILVFYYVPHF